MLFSENCNFWLPKDFMNHYFKADTLELEFTIPFGKIHMWGFKVNMLWGSNYHVFNILLFRPNGIESAFPGVAFTIGVDEHEQTEEMDLIEDFLVDGSQQGMDYEQQDVSDGNDDVSFQDEPVLEDDVVNVLSDVPVVEVEPILEQEFLDVPPIPPVVDQPDEYELTWHLTFRFVIPECLYHECGFICH
ncbi:hypothetical protein Hanom_Chr06g00551801 [Helianthus anomalus]